MNPHQTRLNHLLRLARRAIQPGPLPAPAPTMPPGFAGRVVARWTARRSRRQGADLWERAAAWGAAAAVAGCLLSAAWAHLRPAPEPWDLLLEIPAVESAELF